MGLVITPDGVLSVTGTSNRITVSAGLSPAIDISATFEALLAKLGTANTFTTNGALSAPSQLYTGTWITGGTATTTKPFFLIQPTGTTSAGWDVNGTGLGVNSPSGFVGNLLDLQLNGVTKFSVTSSGSVAFSTTISTPGSVSAGSTNFLRIASRANIGANSDGVIQLGDIAYTNFGRLQLGGSTSSFPSIKRNGTALNFRLADDSADAPITADTIGGRLIGAGATTAFGSDTLYSAFLLGSDLSGGISLSSNITQNTVKSMFYGEMTLSGSGTFTSVRGYSATIKNNGTSVSSILRGGYFSARNNNAGSRANSLVGFVGGFQIDSTGGTVVNGIGIDTELVIGTAGSTLTNLYGIRINDITNAATITNTYGIYIGDVTAGTQTNQAYGIYQADTAARNYFGGNIQIDADIKLSTAGNGLYVKEGTNATSGVATLVAGTVTVSTTKVTANSRIYLTVQSLGTVAVATPIAVTARTAATSFTITSSSITDTSVVGWLIIEPA